MAKYIAKLSSPWGSIVNVMNIFDNNPTFKPSSVHTISTTWCIYKLLPSVHSKTTRNTWYARTIVCLTILKAKLFIYNLYWSLFCSMQTDWYCIVYMLTPVSQTCDDTWEWKGNLSFLLKKPVWMPTAIGNTIHLL
jgi:hypothetical protein